MCQSSRQMQRTMSLQETLHLSQKLCSCLRRQRQNLQQLLWCSLRQSPRQVQRKVPLQEALSSVQTCSAKAWLQIHLADSQRMQRAQADLQTTTSVLHQNSMQSVQQSLYEPTKSLLPQRSQYQRQATQVHPRQVFARSYCRWNLALHLRLGFTQSIRPCGDPRYPRLLLESLQEVQVLQSGPQTLLSAQTRRSLCSRSLLQKVGLRAQSMPLIPSLASSPLASISIHNPW